MVNSGRRKDISVCLVCGADIKTGTVCPKCGKQITEEMQSLQIIIGIEGKTDFSDFSDFSISPMFGEALKNSVIYATPFFSISHLYSRVIQTQEGRDYKGFDIEWSMYLAKQTEKHPPILIVDSENKINVNDPEATLEAITDKVELQNILYGIPGDIENKIWGMVGEYGYQSTSDGEENVPTRTFTLVNPHKIMKREDSYIVLQNGKTPIMTSKSLGSKTAEKIAKKLNLDPDEIEKTLTEIQLGQHEEFDKSEDGSKLEDILIGNNLIYKPCKLLRKPDILLEIDNWNEIVNQVVNYGNTEKDPRLCIIHKATLPKGIDQRANPHSIQALNGASGKTTFYDINGQVFTKVTKNSLIGFAKSPEEVYPGMLNGQTDSIALDQVESGQWSILDYLFNLMESGNAKVSSGSATFTVNTLSNINILANPAVTNGDRESDFGSILIHLTSNPVIGRRFGIFAYGTDYKRINKRDDPLTIQSWKQLAQFYKAVEEYAQPQLKAIYKNPKTWNWLSKPIELKGNDDKIIYSYSKTIDEVLANLTDNKIYTFFKEHSKAGQVRVRAAALNIAIVDNLNKIVLESISLNELLEYAEDHISTITTNNIESINNLVSNYKQDLEIASKYFYETSPAYVQGIINVVINAHRNKLVTGNQFSLKSVEIKPEIEEYEYVSECIDRLLKRKHGLAQLSNDLNQHFGFKYDPDYKNHDLLITYDKVVPDFSYIKKIEVSL